ncbi:MAG: hypothetical protein PHF74_02945 [Dehalococcoidales bacterium]|nr:hypothetical protein [Dehalococcoidales bacterium]
MVQTEGLNLNLVIDESYPGLMKKGIEYRFDGDLKSDYNIEIELDKKLYVTGVIEANRNIKSNKSLKAGENIRAGHSINISDGDIECGETIVAGVDIIAEGNIKASYCVEATGNIQSGKMIKSGWDMKAGVDIKAGMGIESREGIKAGRNIKAAQDIRADKRIEAGGDIEAGWGIRSVLCISCEGTLSAQYGIFAGVCTYKVIASDDSLLEANDRKIFCRKLISGDVLYGILVEREKGN